MPDFRDRQKFKTSEPFIRVDAGLPVGRYQFQLTVVDDQGNSSKPALLNLEIIEGPRLPDPRLVDPIVREPVAPISPISPITPVITPRR
jgi:hypothetical protein